MAKEPSAIDPSNFCAGRAEGVVALQLYEPEPAFGDVGIGSGLPVLPRHPVRNPRMAKPKLRKAPAPRIRPTPRGLGTATSLDATIPRVAAARLEVTLSNGRPAVEVPSALGSVRRHEDASRWIAELGPADRLIISLPDAPAAAGATPVEVEQLLWLKVLCRARSCWTQNLSSSRPTANCGVCNWLPMRTWNCCPCAGPEAPAVQVRAAGELLQIVELQWPRPVTENCVLSAAASC